MGKRGSGKSYTLRRLIKARPRVLIYDTLVEEMYDDCTRIISFPELVDKLSVKDKCFTYAYHDIETPMSMDFDYACRVVYEVGNMTFVVDEIDRHCDSHSMPYSLEKLISFGRHRNVEFVCASRRPYAVNPLIRSQASEVYSFIQTEPRDVDYMREVIGTEAEKLPTLPLHKFIYWNDSAAHKVEKDLTDTDKAIE